MARPSSCAASTIGSRSSTSNVSSLARSGRSSRPPWASRISSRPDIPPAVACGSGVSIGEPSPGDATVHTCAGAPGVAAGHEHVDLVDQRGEVRVVAVARLGQQARDLGADPARVGPEHEDAVRQDHRLFDVVRHDQHRLRREVVVVPEPQQLGPQVLRGEHVEGGEGLVHEQRVGFDDQRAGEADPLAHPARELLGVGRLEAVQADACRWRARRGCGAPWARRRAPRGRSRRSAAPSATAAGRSSGTPWRRRGWRHRALGPGT